MTRRCATSRSEAARDKPFCKETSDVGVIRTAPKDPERKLVATRRNEQLKLAASAFDRLSTVVIAGSLLTPLFQQNHLPLRTLAFWIATAVILRVTAQTMLSFLREET